MQRAAPHALTSPSRTRLWAEFLALFVAAPVAMALFHGAYPLFGALLVFAAVSVVLLSRTPGFALRELARGPVLGQWHLILGFAAIAAAVIGSLVLLLVPGHLLALPRHRTELWLMIMALYPFVSALPQEVIFRVLFFRRYGRLFSGDKIALAANTLAFAAAHLFYQNPVAIGLTLVGGLVFGWVYQRHGSFLLVLVLHALAGQIIFTLGLGIYFYSGAIGQVP